MKKEIKGLRVGISPDFLKVAVLASDGSIEDQPIDPEITAAVMRTAETMESAGAEIITDVPMSNTKYSVPAYFVISRIEAYSNLQRYDGLKYGHPLADHPKDMYDLFAKSRENGFGHEVKLRIRAGLFMSRKDFYEKYYLRAQRARALIRSDYDRIFDPVGEYRLDILLTPSTPLPAFRFDRKGSDPVLIQYADMFTSPMNFAGLPGISVPSGKTSDGLPIGVQFVGSDFCEAKILRVAYITEQTEAFAKENHQCL